MNKTVLPQEILLAEPRGFCAGVDRAIEIVERALSKFGAPIYVRHENLREKFFIPQGIGTGIPGIHAGDIGLILYALAGLPVAYLMVKRFAKRPEHRVVIGLAVGFAALGVILDCMKFPGETNDILRRAQFVEKVFQTLSQMFLLIFIVRYNQSQCTELLATAG